MSVGLIAAIFVTSSAMPLSLFATRNTSLLGRTLTSRWPFDTSIPTNDMLRSLWGRFDAFPVLADSNSRFWQLFGLYVKGSSTPTLAERRLLKSQDDAV
jgi:hypothetical protein